MEIVYIILFFLYGLLFGSFFNVVGLRVPKGESIVHPPSHCPSCNRRLTAMDLVPIFSYLLLKGKCRGCENRISPIYPVMELVTGVLFAFAYYKFDFTYELIVVLLFISLLVIITVSDLAYMLIPNKILFPFALLLAAGRFLSPLDPWWDSITGAVLSFLLLLAIAVLSKGGMGGGDIKLFFVIGIVLGFIQSLLTLFFAAVIGAIAGAIILKKSGKGKKTPVPFAPSIAAAAIIVYFYGHEIVAWYAQLLN